MSAVVHSAVVRATLGTLSAALHLAGSWWKAREQLRTIGTAPPPHALASFDAGGRPRSRKGPRNQTEKLGVVKRPYGPTDTLS